MFYFLLLIIILLITYEYYKYVTSKPLGKPPEIVGLPIIGIYWRILWTDYKFPHKAFSYYTKKLKSKVIGCYFGQFYTVVANDYASIKELLAKEEFDGRLTAAYSFKARAFYKNLGIFFTDGEQWREQRRFALRHMRDFGFGRRQETFEMKSREELSILMDMLKNGSINEDEKKIYNNGLALFPDILYQFFMNNIWEILFGSRFERNEYEKFRYFCRNTMKFQRSGDTTGGAISIWWITCYFGNLFSFKDFIDSNYAMVDFIKKYLNEYKEMHGEDGKYGFVGRYLNKLKESNLSSSFSEEYLIITLLDFLFPTASALPSVVTFAIKFMMHFPNVAKKVRDEIHEVVGSGRMPTWEDRNRLPYTEATLRETMRYETMTPLSVAHRCLKDTIFQGYFIPANTVMVTNLAEMSNDPDLWGDPENFRPERFLNDNERINKKDFSLPFGAGHRLCAGETFARFMIFEVFATLMQNFEFAFVDGQPTKLVDKCSGLIVTPKETWIRLNPYT